MKWHSIKRVIYVCIGSMFLTFGVIGIFLPVIPTTPFLLLASFFYFRSSERMYHWLINHKILGAYIYCYLKYKAIPIKTKIGAIIFLWSTLCISMVLIDSLHVRIFLTVVGIAVSVHLLLLKTITREELETYHNMEIIAQK